MKFTLLPVIVLILLDLLLYIYGSVTGNVGSAILILFITYDLGIYTPLLFAYLLIQTFRKRSYSLNMSLMLFFASAILMVYLPQSWPINIPFYFADWIFHKLY